LAKSTYPPPLPCDHRGKPLIYGHPSFAVPQQQETEAENKQRKMKQKDESED
jgi:hypothetical protein